MKSFPAVGLVVVSYRNNRELIAFLGHLDAFPPSQISQVAVVANGLRPEEVEELKLAAAGYLTGRVHIRGGSQNPGYFGGAALGWRELHRETGLLDWTIVTNDDIRFASDFFSRLSADIPASVGLLAPDIVVPSSGLHQNPLYRDKPAGRRLHALRWLHRHPLVMRAFMGLRGIRQRWRAAQPPGQPPTDGAIYAPHGACLLFSRHYFAAGGTLDYPCFLYGEEFFVAETARRLDLSILLDPSLRAEHFEHSTTGLLVPAAMAKHMHDSLTFILREYYSGD
jgi:GT2 family glycosyltransferase